MGTSKKETIRIKKNELLTRASFFRISHNSYNEEHLEGCGVEDHDTKEGVYYTRRNKL